MRSQEMRDIPVRQELHLGDEEREDLSEIAVVASVEIAPGNAADGWLLHIVVEDEIGPRLSKGDATAELMTEEFAAGDRPGESDGSDGDAVSEGDGLPEAGEQQFDLGALQREFIRPGRGIATITAEVDGAPARRRLANLLEAIEKDGPHAERPAAVATGVAPRRRRTGGEAPLVVPSRG